MIIIYQNRENTEGIITYAEACEALKDMKNNKSPGPDGFSVEFYKFFFRDIGMFWLRSINEGFYKGQLSVTQRQGIIVCIPKDNKPKQYIKNWRPISLLNISYKILSTCIANRLKTFLHDIIHDNQKGFMKGRYIGENIRKLYDIMLYTEKEHIPGLLLMIDFRKAYDSISWSFMHKALDFFNLGPDLKKWIRTMYEHANSCILVNGQYSSWFDIQRGARQGDPSSPYIYLICAEILGIMIRQNGKIKGIKVKEMETLLSQFADDTTLSLDGSEECFVEAIRTLDIFADISGLKINPDKTQIVWIGSTKNCGRRYLRDKNFCWDPGIFRVLGIKFSTTLENILELNLEGKIQEIKKVIGKWKKRNLTPFGKITILKSLIASKLIYILSNLPDPNVEFMNEIEKIFFDFLWEGKPSKIKKSIICKTYADGGLRMIDIHAFLSSMKVSWIRRINCESNLQMFVQNMCPELFYLKQFGVDYISCLMLKIDNPFWRDVLKHFKRYCTKCIPENLDEFMSECLFYNDNITRGNRTIFVKEWKENGIMYIRDLINENGTFYNFNEFKLKYSSLFKTNFLLYEGIIKAVKTYQIKCNITLESVFKIQESKPWVCLKKGKKMIQNILLQSSVIPTSVNRWKNQSQNFEWKTIFHHCYTTTKDTKLRWFQIRVLNRILPTNKMLKTCKIVEEEHCTFCKQETETIDHLFWECSISLEFWKSVEEYLKKLCVHCSRLVFKKELILFGISEMTITDKAIDFIILLGKYFFV